jgi:hypothetical protein
MDRGRLGAREYVSVYWPAAPGFALEWLSDSSLRDFRLHGQPGELVRFAVFSCMFLVLIAAATATLRFGIGFAELSAKDHAIWRDAIRVGAIAAVISVALGTFLVFTRGAVESSLRLNMLEAWFYKAALIVYFLVTMKMMLPLVLKRVRVAFDRRAPQF